MVKRPFEANGLNNDDDYGHETYPDRQRGETPEQSRIAQPHGSNKADIVGKWFEEKILRNDRNSQTLIHGRGEPPPLIEEDEVWTEIRSDTAPLQQRGEENKYEIDEVGPTATTSDSTLYYFTAEEWSLSSNGSSWDEDSAAAAVITTENMSPERDNLILSKDIFGALVRHELRHHSDNEDNTPMEECMFTQFILDEMEERHYNEAEAKLTALISEVDIMSRNEYSFRNIQQEDYGEGEYSSLDHSIGEEEVNLPRNYIYKPIDRFFKVKRTKENNSKDIDYENTQGMTHERRDIRQKNASKIVTKRGGTQKPPPNNRITNASLLVKVKGTNIEPGNRYKRTTVWTKNKTHLG
eukprot:scaffold30518_cov44-Cyclotella_meneghiniana.AAC.4